MTRAISFSDPAGPARLEDFQPDPHNANRGTLRGLQLLDASVETYGAGRGIVADKHGRIIAGNKTLEVAVAHGLGVRVVESDGTRLIAVRRDDLSIDSPAGRELAYLDNRAGELGLFWDGERLAEDAVALDLSPLFTSDELLAITSGAADMDVLYLDDDGRAIWQAFRAKIGESPEALDAWVSAQLEVL